ncbi:hypothetical protein WOLCODRAFT_75866 [Wolfiporia cocos MD-104 SS10]|uniref:Rds1 protein n=1 Tax=Wolfiporia cocos (strain MD-104) TaxID=742152 RepID=A0A2H3JND8_WOLCO|nr:hypothetical protein WOLCODRAFT_75866 [Wolfiporia cocos MD-104 SS10]
MRPLLIPLIAGVCAELALALPYTPVGGLDTNSSSPVYQPLSDFDYQSLNLALYQELIELDLFHNGLAKFSVQDFEDAGLTAEDRYLIEFMADQEVGHATMVSNLLGPNNASKSCEYSYPFETVREFIEFNEMVTRFGESGTYGFLEHLNSRAAAQLLLQSITTEARQQMIFRQFEGIFPMPMWFVPAVTQSMQWTLMAPYIVSCPAENNRVQFQNFPALNITNNPNVTEMSGFAEPAITRNHSAFSAPGDTLYLSWESPGKSVGPNNSYITNTTAGSPQFVAWISQLNTTYTPLTNVSGNSGQTTQPGGEIYGNHTFSTYNGTLFVLVTDSDLPVTPANISLMNQHVVAGPALYQSG